jgi:hypothetical protein
MFLVPVTKVELSWEVPSETRISGMFQEYLSDNMGIRYRCHYQADKS